MSKATIVTLFISVLLITQKTYSNIFRVNNTLATDKARKIFASLQAANDSSYVLAGDTLMIEGSPNEYENLALTKRLVLIGPGYFLAENPQTQAYPGKAVVRQIACKTGASGSVIMGVTFSSGFYTYTPYIETTNILIMRCYLSNPVYINTTGTNNLQIIQCYAEKDLLQNGYSSYAFTGATVRNNVIGGNLIITSDNTYQRLFNAVDNNIFLGDITITTNTFRSNIIVKSANPAISIMSPAIQNNLMSATQLPATNGNQTYTAANLFVGSTGNSPDGQYKLKPSSPYLTAGYAGTQPGIFGGSQPYVLSGMPPIPAIYEFNADGFANKAAGLPVNIKVKANQ